MEENKTSADITANGTTTEPKVENKDPETFSETQQLKVNSLIKEERARVLNKLGVTSIDEARAKLESANELENFKAKASEYDKASARVRELESENAMLKLGVSDEMKDVVKNYFKGAEKELNVNNLTELFENNPTLKSQWTKQEKVVNNVAFGNPIPEKPNDDPLAEFYKYTKYKK